MPLFNYRARDHQGNLQEGELDFPSPEALAADLVRRSLTVVNIEEKIEVKKMEIQWKKKDVSIDERVVFCRQMKALSKSGIPIVQAINGLADSHKNEYFSEILRSISATLVTGSDLASSLNAFPKVFDDLFVSLIHVGESTGKLEEAFAQLVGHLELERETKKRLKSAFRYPTMVMGAMGIALFIINMWVIPAFAKVFSKLGADLPMPTKILMATSDFTVDYWWLILAVLIGSYVGFKKYTATEKGELWWDTKKLKFPLVGSLLERIALSRFSRSFSLLISSGVPVLQSLTIVAGAVGNKRISLCLHEMRTGVERGDSLTRTASQTGLFTPLILQMMSVGEETGAVDQLLSDVADFYEEEIDYDLKTLADSIEPILLVFMGILVLVLALGVFLPVWDLSSVAIKK